MMPSCNTYHLTWFSLTLGMGCLFTAAPAKRNCYFSKAQPLLLPLDEGYLLTTSVPDLQRGIAPLGPPVPAQPPLLGRGVAPPGRRPWPWMRGSSSWPFLHHRSLALSATAPDLGRGVAPLTSA